VRPLFVEERNGDALAAMRARVDGAEEPDRGGTRSLGNFILGDGFKRHHQDMLFGVVMGEPGLHSDTQLPWRTDRRADPDLVVGAGDDRRRLGTERLERFAELRHRHLGPDAESSQRRSELSPCPARLLFQTEDELQDRVGWFGH
jgi:hypothetical protein